MTEVHSPIYMNPAAKSDKGAMLVFAIVAAVALAGVLCLGLQLGERRLEETAIYNA